MKSLLRSALLALTAIVCSQPAFALGDSRYVTAQPLPGSFGLAASGAAVPLLVSGDDWPGVRHAAADFAADVARVTGLAEPAVLDAAAPQKPYLVIIGTIGHSAVIDGLVRRGKLDVSGVRGQWEAAVTTIVEWPMPGVRRALVVAGSDKRGTIFGVYTLSEQIGVSPWYWWADVRVPHQDALYVQPGRRLLEPPAVKYRGIFLNDEAPALTGWVNEKFGGFNSKFYVHVFELLLRLRANYLWPAMWNSAFNEDDPLNPKLADEYGIVMGTSHHEPMIRAQQEWKRHGTGEWNYATNQAVLEDFWRKGIERNKNYESTITVGMRGDGDKPMSATDDVGLLEKIVANQLQILSQNMTPDVATEPKIWALYKEVQGYYEKGMRVPDNVTLLWSDDNWGNIRRLPTLEERKRPGGAGIYYHFDYVGGPRSYKWLNTYNITKVWEQMHLALEYGADRVWVVNVGDLKPMEFPIEFFLTYAHDPKRWTQNDLHTFTVDWAAREFGPAHAEEIARCMEDYTRYNSWRKPEMLEPTTFSTNYGEAERVAAMWTDLMKRVDALAGELPADEQASFFELVQYPAKASGNLALLYLAAGRNATDARSGRVTTNADAAEVRQRFAEDATLTDEYNRKLLNGRWDHMMDQTHLGYTFWNQPPLNTMPAVSEVQESPRAEPPRPEVQSPAAHAATAPADFKGFVETMTPAPPRALPGAPGMRMAAPGTGYVAIEAADVSEQSPDPNGTHWGELPGYGATKSAMTVFPVTAASSTTSKAALRYRMYLADGGDFTLHLTLAPTVNFVPGRGLRLQVSIDNGPRTLVDVLEHNTQRDWEKAVGDGVKQAELAMPGITQGTHVLSVWAVDPGVVLERLVLSHGPLAPSYLGPPESAQEAGGSRARTD